MKWNENTRRRFYTIIIQSGKASLRSNKFPSNDVKSYPLRSRISISKGVLKITLDNNIQVASASNSSYRRIHQFCGNRKLTIKVQHSSQPCSLHKNANKYTRQWQWQTSCNASLQMFSTNEDFLGFKCDLVSVCVCVYIKSH